MSIIAIINSIIDIIFRHCTDIIILKRRVETRSSIAARVARWRVLYTALGISYVWNEQTNSLRMAGQVLQTTGLL